MTDLSVRESAQLCNEILFDDRTLGFSDPRHSPKKPAMFNHLMYMFFTTCLSKEGELWIAIDAEEVCKKEGFNVQGFKKFIAELVKAKLIRRGGKRNKTHLYATKEVARLRSQNNEIVVTQGPLGRRKGTKNRNRWAYCSIGEYLRGKEALAHVDEIVEKEKKIFHSTAEFYEWWKDYLSGKDIAKDHCDKKFNKLNYSKNEASPVHECVSKDNISKTYLPRYEYLKAEHEKAKDWRPIGKEAKEVYDELRGKNLKHYQVRQFMTTFSLKRIRGVLERAKKHIGTIWNMGGFLWDACKNYEKYPENWVPKHARRVKENEMTGKIMDRLKNHPGHTKWNLDPQKLNIFAKFTWGCVEAVLWKFMEKTDIVNSHALLYSACAAAAQKDNSLYSDQYNNRVKSRKRGVL